MTTTPHAHPMLAIIPDDLLFRADRADVDGRRAGQLVRWLDNRNVRASLLDLEAERLRRTHERNSA